MAIALRSVVCLGLLFMATSSPVLADAGGSRPPAGRAAQVWGTIQSSTSAAVLEAFIKEFPDSVYATLARARLMELREGTIADAPGFKPGDEFQDCNQCPKMVVMPAGGFMMGSAESDRSRRSDEGPARHVTIPDAFAVSKFEITVGEYTAFVGQSGYSPQPGCRIFDVGGNKSWTLKPHRSYRDPGFTQGNHHPVACVSWHDATAYVGWLNGRDPAARYRLLSEAEWEYAARAGTIGQFSFGGGDAQLCTYANGADRSTGLSWRNRQCDDGVGTRTAPVGSYAPNSFGLHDMHGNLWEWVEDCYREGYAGGPMDGKPITTGACDRRVLRGGGWNSAPTYLRSAIRDKFDAGGRYSNGGFRVAKTLTP